MLLLILRSYCMGAGTYTGIEAVSNGLPVLREPRVRTAKRTMRYMAISLAVMVMGLMFAYLLYRVEPQSGKTLNAVLFEHVTGDWGDRSKTWFVIVTLAVFITFVLSQLGMVRHWWSTRTGVKHRWWKLLINGVGLVLTVFILVSVTVLKFHEGGWITLLVTGSLAGIAVVIKGHYYKTGRLLSKLDNLVEVAESSGSGLTTGKTQDMKSHQGFDPTAKTAVLLVSGFNGRELHTLFSVFRTFEKTFRNFVFVDIGMVDAGNFKGLAEIEHLRAQIKSDLDRFVYFVQRHGYYAEGFYSIGVDVVDEIAQITLRILERFPNPVFFGGQLIFPNDSFLSRWLHNYTVFAVQRRLYSKGIPVVIMPIRV